MSILWPFRQQCFQLLQHHITANPLRTIAMNQIHTRARKSPYAGTKDIHVRFLSIRERRMIFRD